MNTALAFRMGEMNRHKELMVFDWDKAARLIRDSECEYANAGLRGDWEYTGGCIFSNKRAVMDDYTFLASTWAVPEIEIDGVVHECYKMESETNGWNSDTKWQKSARDILFVELEVEKT